MPVRVRPRAQKATDPVHVATHDRQSQTPLRPHQFARFCRKNPDLPHTALRARLESDPTLSCNSSVTAIAILGTSRAHPLARWHRFVSIERPEPLQTALQGTSARAMVYRKNSCLHTGCLLWILGTITLLSEGNTRLVEAVHRYNANSFQEVPRCLSSL